LKEALFMRPTSTFTAWLARAGLAVVVVGAACCNKQAGKIAGDESVWSVRIGASGGFTGGGSGHVIMKDGTVHAWSQIVPSDSTATKDFGKASAEAMTALRRALADPALRTLHHDATGNMTGSLDWFDGTKMHHWSWAEKIGDLDLPPPPARARAAATAVRTARP
jgi:hypothetical protein